MQLADKRILVIGLGRSGVAAATLCRARGARVTGYDVTPVERLGEAARALAAQGLPVLGGELTLEVLRAAEHVVLSPGVPATGAIAAFEQAGGEVLGELELAYRVLCADGAAGPGAAPVVLVGGTNGKSTTTALVGAMLQADGRRVFVGGNFGTPLSEAVGQPVDAFVVEVSSYQAERMPGVHARVHVLLNVTEDHLDRYPSLESYAHAKGNPFVAMTTADAAVVPLGDALCEEQAARGAARRLRFGEDAQADVYVDGRDLVDRRNGARYAGAELPLCGRHNLQNACAAIAAAGDLGVAPEAIRRALVSFTGLPHRMELVGSYGGVRYLDDSKGTNVGATVAALRGLTEPVVLIAGGRDKQGSYGPLVEALGGARALVVLGEAAERIAAAARGTVPIERVVTMADAVAAAARLAQPGDVVLLSPACSSFDMFRDYKERGQAFASAVKRQHGPVAGQGDTDG